MNATIINETTRLNDTNEFIEQIELKHHSVTSFNDTFEYRGMSQDEMRSLFAKQLCGLDKKFLRTSQFENLNVHGMIAFYKKYDP